MKQIFVDSRDRTPTSNSTTDFTISFPTTLTLTANQRLRFDNLRIPHVILTIRTGENDTMTLQTGVGTYTITLPQGQYDGPGLASTLQSILASTCPGNWRVDYDTANISMVISCTNDFTIRGGTYAAQLMAHPYTRTGAQYRFTFVSMSGIDIMYLCCSQLVNLDTFGPKGSSDTVMCAVVTCGFGSVLDVSMPYDCWIDAPAMTTQNMSFTLRDRNYKVLTIVPTISFVITID